MRYRLCLLALGLLGCASSKTLYQSPNNIDSVKIVKARGAEAEGLKHPFTFKPDQIRSILRSIHFNKKILIAEDLGDRQLFEERHIEFLTPHLVEAFKQATPGEVVAVSFFTQSAKFGLGNDRLTIFRAFVKEDGLHLKFSKIYAKMLGDRTTKGAHRAVQEAKGLRVSLETQPGQTRIGWDPEEIAFKVPSGGGGGRRAPHSQSW